MNHITLLWLLNVISAEEVLLIFFIVIVSYMCGLDPVQFHLSWLASCKSMILIALDM